MSFTYSTELNFDNIPSLDISVLHGFDDPDMSSDLVTELIELYLAETQRLLQLLSTSVSAGEWSTTKRTAHTIKGSSANLGLHKMAHLSEQIEYGEHTAESVEALLQQITEEFSLVSNTLNAERQRRKQCAY